MGKSTLLRAIARRTVVGASKSGNGGGVPDHLRILHVAQEVHGDDTPVIKSVLQADAYRLSLLRREKEINGLLDEVHGGAKGEEGKVELTQTERDALANELKVLYSKLQYIEADKAESR